MKKLISIIACIAVIGALAFIFKDALRAQTDKVLAVSLCEQPKPYSIGRVDPQFQLSEVDFKAAVQEATEVWSQAYGKQLFVFDPESTFTVNLLYDERQTLNTEINEKNEDLKVKDSSLRPQIEEYNRKSVALQSRIKALNEEIESWNAKGGAPDDVYNRLRTEQATLREEMAALNKEADSLSLTTDELRDEAASLEDTVTTFNDALHDRPEGGKYTLDEKGERIDISIFDGSEELVNVLSHEFGHSLGMDHVDDNQAIMYAKTNEATAPTMADMNQLQFACRKRNLVKERWDFFRENFFSRLGSFITFGSSN